MFVIAYVWLQRSCNFIFQLSSLSPMVIHHKQMYMELWIRMPLNEQQVPYAIWSLFRFQWRNFRQYCRPFSLAQYNVDAHIIWTSIRYLLFTFMCYKCWSDGASARHHYLRSLNAIMLYRMPIFLSHRILHRNNSFALCTRMFVHFGDYFPINMSCGQNTTYFHTSRELWFQSFLLNIPSHFNSCAHK